MSRPFSLLENGRNRKVEFACCTTDLYTVLISFLRKYNRALHRKTRLIEGNAKCRHLKNWLLLTLRRGGGGETREKVTRATVHKVDWNYQHDLLYLQSIHSDQHLPPSPAMQNVVILKNWPVKAICGWYLAVYTGKGRGDLEPERRQQGATVHKAGSKIPTWLPVSPVYTLW